MSLYYQDDHVTLYHGDALEILPTLDTQAAVLLTDPPYFRVKKDAWDNQWGGADKFLAWMGEWLDLAKPRLADNASAWVFASPQMTTAVERVVGMRFRVLNNIRWVKEAGWHQRSSLPALRSYLTPWEGVVFAEQFGHDDDSPTGIWSILYEPIRAHLNDKREDAGLTMQQVNKAWQAMRGTKGQIAGHWFSASQWIIPTPEHHAFMVNLGMDLAPYGELRKWYDEIRADYANERRPFAVADRSVSTDIWTFGTVKPYPGKHPCEKPQDMLAHMIEASSRPGDLILDPFAGSGSTLDAASRLGRRAVGIEQDEGWCETIAKRLSQEEFDFGGIK